MNTQSVLSFSVFATGNPPDAARVMSLCQVCELGRPCAPDKPCRGPQVETWLERAIDVGHAAKVILQRRPGYVLHNLPELEEAAKILALLSPGKLAKFSELQLELPFEEERLSFLLEGLVESGQLEGHNVCGRMLYVLPLSTAPNH